MRADTNPRQLVIDACRFNNPGGLPMEGNVSMGGRNDFYWLSANPHPDYRPSRENAYDEWGAYWENIGICQLGEVKKYPLEDWEQFPTLKIPDVHDPKRWGAAPDAKKNAGDRFLMGYIGSIYERTHFLRGLENVWCDIYEYPEELSKLVNILVDMDIGMLDHYAAAGCDGCIMSDDWGLQDRLMIAPDKWRELWKGPYKRLFTAAHERGLITFMHSCGYTIDILGDLIECGLDVIQYDQQMNMGLEALHRFAGKVTFFSPVDIQAIMPKATPAEVRSYARRMVSMLGTPKGGFIYRAYTDYVGAGHTPENCRAEEAAFLEIDEDIAAGRFEFAE